MVVGVWTTIKPDVSFTMRDSPVIERRIVQMWPILQRDIFLEKNQVSLLPVAPPPPRNFTRSSKAQRFTVTMISLVIQAVACEQFIFVDSDQIFYSCRFETICSETCMRGAKVVK